MNWKNAGLIAVGAAIGLGVALVVAPSLRPEDSPAQAVAKSIGSREEAISSLPDDARRIADLEAEIQALRVAATKTIAIPSDVPALQPEEVRKRLEVRRQEALESSANRDTDRLLAANFTKERIAWLTNRADELKEKFGIQEAERRKSGRPMDLRDRKYAYTPDIDLSQEIGDDEYTRYLQALDRPIGVDVQTVPAGTNAASAGLKAGDEILSYGGKRVYNAFQMREFEEQNKSSGTTAIQVRREGQVVSLLISNGPSGVKPKSYIQRALEHGPRVATTKILP